MDKNAYPVFPDADSGADPAVPAEQGGRGFTGEGWETNTDFALIGDPRNDENIFVSQLQLESHRFHNKINNERCLSGRGRG